MQIFCASLGTANSPFSIGRQGPVLNTDCRLVALCIIFMTPPYWSWEWSWIFCMRPRRMSYGDFREIKYLSISFIYIFCWMQLLGAVFLRREFSTTIITIYQKMQQLQKLWDHQSWFMWWLMVLQCLLQSCLHVSARSLCYSVYTL